MEEMLFRSFLGFEKTDKVVMPIYDDEKTYTLDDLGKQVIYSKDIKLNSRCLLGADSYREAPLTDFNWHAEFAEWVKYMDTCFDIGCMTFRSKHAILTDKVYLNAYSSLSHDNSFYIIFHARPSRPINCENILTVGYDKYSFVHDRYSIVVWNLDHFVDMNLKDYTFWGIRQGTRHGVSATDDEFVGLKDGEEVFAIT